jgi:foldase protein PrsA
MAVGKTTRKSSRAVKSVISSDSSEKKTLSIKERIRKPKFIIGLAVVLVIALAFYFRGLFVVAIVNGQPITRLSIIQELEKQGGRQALDTLVNQLLIEQEAKKKNVEVSPEEVEGAIKEIEDSLKEQGQDLNTVLSIQGMSRDDFVKQLEIRTLVEKLLADQIKVTDKEVEEYLEQNKEVLPEGVEDNELRKQVEDQLKQQKLGSQSQEWIDNLNKEANINYFINY